MEIKGSWVVVSIDGVLADPAHREHLRPKYRKGSPPSKHEMDTWMEGAINDLPVPETVAMIKAMMAQGHSLMLVGSIRFPVKHWFNLHLPDMDLRQMAHISYAYVKGEQYISYEEQVFGQLKALRDAGGTVSLALLRMPLYQSLVRYLFPKAIVGSATSTEGKAAEKRGTSAAAGLDEKVSMPLTLRFYMDDARVPRARPPAKPFYWFVNRHRWGTVDPAR